MSEPLKVSMAFIAEADRYFFEQRTKGRANGALGKIGCFGGEIKIDETPREAVHREVIIEEVAGLEDFSPEKFWRFKGTLEVDSDRDNQPVKVEAHVYKLLLPFGYGDKISAPNSIWLKVDELQLALENHQLTPATEMACVEYLGMEKTPA